jgi:hypothetical protein
VIAFESAEVSEAVVKLNLYETPGVPTNCKCAKVTTPAAAVAVTFEIVPPAPDAMCAVITLELSEVAMLPY